MKNLFYTFAAFIFFSSVIFSQPDTLTILHVNDSHSTLEAIGPRDANLKGTLGGISRVATLVGMTKMTEPNVLFLHAGDISIGDVFFNRNFHVPELQILSALGVDAVTLGNHEFDLGPEALLGSISYTFPDPAEAFPILTANVDFSDPTIAALQNYVDAYTIKEFGDLKVGIFGLTTPATNLLSNPSPAVVSEDIVTIAATMVGTLRTVENCDVVIFLSHLGVALDQAIVTYVPGIDVIVGGHDHYKYEEPITMTDPVGGTTWIVQARSNYMYAGEMKLLVDGTNVQLLNYQLIPIDENIPQEPTVQAIVDGMIEEIETFYGIPFFSQPFGNATAFFEEEAKDLLMLGAHDTPAGNLVADAFRSYTSTDIALQAGGSIALPLWEGTFTLGDLFRVNGYGFNLTNTLGFQLATFDLTGMDILTGLTFGLSEIEMNDEFLIQVSGMEYTYDGTKPAEERLVSVKIGGIPIDPTALYSVTANEMVLGILDFIGIVPANVVILEGTTEFEALSNYTITLQNVLTPSTSGRVSNLNNPVPVELTSFTANSVDGFVKLIWITATELNNHGFEIQRRVAESDFATIGFVRGEGTTTNHKDYSYIDNDLVDGKYFYRLKQVDYNGSYEYSNVIEVDVRSLNEYTLEQNYPNPFNPITTIGYVLRERTNTKLVLLNAIGEEVSVLINEEQDKGFHKVDFNATNLASGVYFYRLQAGQFSDTKKLILMK